MKSACSLDIYPARTQFRPGEDVELCVELGGPAAGSEIEIEVLQHHRSIWKQMRQVNPNGTNQPVVINLGAFAEGGYKVLAKRIEDDDPRTASTAFDVRSHWHDSPRYGFIANFDMRESYQDIETFFRKFHLNVVQFYDWMERHDALVPKSQTFIDPMGRQVDTQAILSRIASLKAVGTAPIAYAAVYASLADYAEQHPEQGIYDNLKKQYSLIDTFFLMDISEGSPWRDHILQEFAKVLDFGFEGLHLDQYGFPKSARRWDGSVFWMDQAYASFINDCRRKFGRQTGLIFNAVSSYPIHAVGPADQDVVYVEVWAPMVRYRHLTEVVTKSRAASGNTKHVVLAAYFKAFREAQDADPQAVSRSALLTTTVIVASGGYHLVLGESSGILTEAYYPDYIPGHDAVMQPLRRLYDLVTSDAALLSGPDVTDVTWSFFGDAYSDVVVTGAPVSIDADAGSVWIRITKTHAGLVIHLVNLLWVTSDTWNAVHDEPFRQTPPLEVTVEWNHPVDDVWVQRAEAGIWSPAEWSWQPHHRGEAIHVEIPSFDVWTMLLIPYPNTSSDIHPVGRS